MVLHEIYAPERCPVCESAVEVDPEEDYGVAGRRWRGWSCLDETGVGCDAGELVSAGSWRDC